MSGAKRTDRGPGAPEATDRRDSVLEAVVFAAESFLRTSRWDEKMPEVLGRLGVAVGADTAYVYAGYTDSAGRACIRQLHRWIAPGAELPFGESGVAEFCWDGGNHMRWVKVLGAGGVLAGPVSELPAKEQPALSALGVRSLVIVPIFSGDRWWGLIGFDEYKTDRVWSAGEIDALKGAGDALGAAIQRQQAAEALRQSERQYRTLVEDVPVGIYRTTPDGEVLTANKTLLEMLGYSSLAELKSRDLEKEGFAPWCPRRRFKETIERAGEVKDFHSEWVRRDGAIVFVRENAAAVRDGEGNAIYYEGIVEDVSEQKQAEQALARRDRILRAVAFAAECFLETPAWQESMREVVARLGQAADADVAYVYRNYTDGRGCLCAREFEKWFAPSVQPRQDELDHADRGSWEAGGYGRWIHVLGGGGIVSGLVEDLPPGEQPSLAALGIRSLVVMPIFRGRQWWGLMGFEDRTSERVWSAAEIDALKAAAGALGAAIHREQAELALRESERRYRSFVQNLRGMAFQAEGNFIPVFFHGAVEEITGYTEREFVAGEPRWDQIIHPDDLARWRRSAEKVLTTPGHSIDQECRIVRKDGQVRWVQEVVQNVSADPESSALLQGMVYDVTLRKMAQEALRQSEEKYRTLVESAGDAICMLNEDCEILFLNARAAATGKKSKDFIGKTLWDLFPKEIADRHAAGVREVIRTGRGLTADARVLVGGADRWYQTRAEPIRDGDGQPMAAMIIARDVTEQKRAAEQVRRSELLYRTTIDAMSDPLHVVGGDLKFTLFNATLAQWCRELGIEEPEIGKSVFDVFEFLPKKVSQEYQQVFKTGRAMVTEETSTVDGREIFTETQKIPLREGERVARVITVIRDITERKRAEAALRAARAKIDNAQETERKRLAGELHDSIGQRLVALRLALQNLAAGTGARLDADARDRLAAASESCQDLIREVRHASHGLYPPTLESLGLISALRQLADDCRGAEVTAEVRCEQDFLGAQCPQEVEITLFRIAQEAVNNALTHGKCRHVKLQLRRRGDSVVLAVTDDGRGFVVEDAPGGGLGLNMMRQRASGVGGEVRIASRPGQTRIEVSVPCTCSPATEPPAGGQDTPAET